VTSSGRRTSRSSPARRPYATSLFALWAVKTRLAELDPVDAETQELFDLGHALEEPIAERYTAITGRPLRRRRQLLVHPRESWMGASLDRLSARKGERRIVEIKWVPHRRWATDGPEAVPSYVQDQVQWQLAVTGYDVADVAVLSGSHVEVHEIGPSERYQADLIYLGRDFWDRVEKPASIRPSTDPRRPAPRSRGCTPATRSAMAVPTPEIAALAYAIRDATVAKKAAVEEDGRLRNLMRLLLEGHAGVEDEDYRIHFRRSADRIVATTDWPAVAEAYGGALEPISDLGPGRRSRVTSEDVGRRARSTLAIESLFTTTEVKEGSRSLIPKFRGDDGRWS
jgi:putative phage-type endonuclease